jgi:hypothetical protein
VAKELSQQGVEHKDTGWLVFWNIAIESLPMEEVLSDNKVGGLIAANGVTNVGSRSEENEKQCHKKPKAGALASGGRTIRGIIYHNLHAHAAVDSE